MAYSVDEAFSLVICNGVQCYFDECELAGNCCAFCITDKKILVDIARRRYEKREKTPSLEECMRVINNAFPRETGVITLRVHTAQNAYEMDWHDTAKVV